MLKKPAKLGFLLGTAANKPIIFNFIKVNNIND